MIHYAARLADLRSPPGNRLEALSGELKGWHSIRVNEQCRILFGQRKEKKESELMIITELRNRMNSLKRKPTSPGEILRKEFLLPLNITQKQLADHIGCDLKVINRIREI